jgi:hypothetical protein
MQSKYHLFIYAFDRIEYFMIYDENTCLFYNGNVKIKDKAVSVSSLQKVYTRFYLTGMQSFLIDEKCFNLCLDFDFNEISKMTKKQVLDMIELEEYAI